MVKCTIRDSAVAANVSRQTSASGSQAIRRLLDRYPNSADRPKATLLRLRLVIRESSVCDAKPDGCGQVRVKEARSGGSCAAVTGGAQDRIGLAQGHGERR